MPQDSKVVGIAPVTLDTPGNREAMPGADTSTWTPLGHVAQQLFTWAEDPTLYSPSLTVDSQRYNLCLSLSSPAAAVAFTCELACVDSCTSGVMYRIVTTSGETTFEPLEENIPRKRSCRAVER